MKRFLMSWIMALIIMIPFTGLADTIPGTAGNDTSVEVGTDVINEVNVSGPQFNTYGSTGVNKSLVGSVNIPYLNMQQATTPYPIGSWRQVVLPPRGLAELYTAAELNEIVSEGKDIFQITGKLRLVVPKHDRKFIYTLPSSLNLPAKGLVPIFIIEGEAPANGNLDELLLRLQSFAYASSNSFLTTIECTDEMLNKFANNGGGFGGGGSGFMGNVLTSTGITAQESVAVSRAFRVPKCRVSAWSTNVADFDDYISQASAQPPELLYNLYLYKDAERRRTEISQAMARIEADEAFLRRLRQASEVDFIGFYLNEADKTAVQSQLEAFRNEFCLKLQEKGISTEKWQSRVLAADPKAPARERNDISGGVALYYR